MKAAQLATLRLVDLPAFVRLGIRVERAPGWVWRALLALAMLPLCFWIAHCLLLGSFDAPGPLALLALVCGHAPSLPQARTGFVSNTFLHRVLGKLFAAAGVPVCALLWLLLSSPS